MSNIGSPTTEPHNLARWLARGLSVAALLAICLSAAGMLLDWGSGSTIDIWNLLGQVAWCVAALGILSWAVLEPAFRVGRLLIGSAFLCYGVGQVGSQFVQNSAGELPTWSWPDIFWLSFYPLMAVGLVMLTIDRRQISPARALLDAAMVSLGCLSALAFGIALANRAGIATTNSDALDGIWPYLAADALLFGLMLGLWNARRRVESPWSIASSWIFAIVALLALIDITYYFINGSGAVDLWPAQDLLELLPPSLIALAVLVNTTNLVPERKSKSGKTATMESGLSGALPIAAVAVALGVLIGSSVEGNDPLILLFATATVVCVLARLLIAYRDNRALAASRIEARTDELTGLPNRRGLSTGPWSDARYIEPTAPECGRAVLVLRLERFDGIEDALGQETGDALMVVITERLRAAVRPTDVLARVLGAQFAVVLNDLTARDIEATAERILAATDEPVGQTTMRLAATVGVTWSAWPYPSIDEQVRQAGIAKNSASRRRARLAVFNSSMDNAPARLQMTIMFERAVRENVGLALQYQPIIDLQTGCATGVEALLRWTAPDGESVSPEEFMPLAITAGLAPELGAWVLNEAIGQLASWRSASLEIPVNVNLVADNLTANLPSQIADLLRANAVTPDLLTVELVEDSAINDLKGVRSVLAQLRATGVKIAIDDFGTGWSALSYLQNLDVDVLKIDRSFVMGMASDPVAKSIVTSTVELATELGLIVVGEGIEEENEYTMLREMGCHRGQGFGLAKPMSAAALGTWWLANAADAVSEIKLPE